MADVSDKPVRISGTDFINMRLNVYKSDGTIDDLVNAWREATGSDKTDDQIRQYMGTRTSSEKKKLVRQGFNEDQIAALLPALKKASRADSTAYVSSMQDLLTSMGVSSDLTSADSDTSDDSDTDSDA